MSKCFLFFVVSIFAVSCAPRFDVKINAKNEVFLDLDIKPALATRQIIKSLFTISEGSSSENIKEGIYNEIIEGGVEIIHAKRSDSFDVSASIKFPKSFFSDSGIFVLKNNQASFSLDREKLNTFLSILPKEDKEYIDLLMAPSVQNENMSEDEYVKLIANAYGNTVANELKASSFIFSFEVPNEIKDISTTPEFKYSFNGKKVELSIPLTSIFVLECPISVDINY